MEDIKIKIKKITPDAKLPTKAHPTDACYDLYANEFAKIYPHTTVKVHTGISTEIPVGYWGAVFARSGIAIKQSLRPANCVGVIDADYRGEWIVGLHNDSEEVRTIEIGERIAQMMILPVLPTIIEEVEELEDTERGAGGLGSTGK